MRGAGSRWRWTTGLMVVAMFVAGCGSVATSPKPTSTTMPKVTLKWSCPCLSAAPQSPQTEALYRTASQVFAMTHGAVTIEVFPNSSLLPQATEFEGVQQGAADMSDSSPDQYQATFPAGMIYEIPYLYTNWSQVTAAFNSGAGKQLNAQVVQKLGVRLLGVQDLGPRELDLNVTKKIMTPADMAGIKLRMPPGPYWAQLGQAMGGAVTPVGFTEIYLSLQTGVVQAQDNPLPTDIADKFYQVTKQIVLTNHLFSPVMPTINENSWNKLSAAEQKDLVTAVTQQDTWASNQVAALQASDITFLKNQGLQVYSPNIAAFRAPVLKSFLCDPTYVSGFVPGMLNSVLKIAGATRPSC
ncbi:MAG: TRAP transporter substrate-binding protein DctP [Candidatus Dormibacteria bacterium]